MSETPKIQSWWHTLPGVLTALAAAITAITGLVAVVMQSRSGSAQADRVAAVKPVASDSKPAEPGPKRSADSTGSTSGDNTQGTTRPDDSSKPSTATTPPPDPSAAPKPMLVELPDGKEAVMAAFGDKFKYSVLAATAQPLPPDKTQVTLKVRAYTTAAGGLNFWSDSFRIALGDQRFTPTNNINVLVKRDATAEAEFEFNLPDAVREARLLIKVGGRSFDGDQRELRLVIR